MSVSAWMKTVALSASAMCSCGTPQPATSEGAGPGRGTLAGESVQSAKASKKPPRLSRALVQWMLPQGYQPMPCRRAGSDTTWYSYNDEGRPMGWRNDAFTMRLSYDEGGSLVDAHKTTNGKVKVSFRHRFLWQGGTLGRMEVVYGSANGGQPITYDCQTSDNTVRCVNAAKDHVIEVETDEEGRLVRLFVTPSEQRFMYRDGRLHIVEDDDIAAQVLPVVVYEYDDKGMVRAMRDVGSGDILETYSSDCEAR